MLQILPLLGFKPYKEGKGCTWFLSPFKEETDPSFKVEDNKFHDFGSGQRGGVIDLVILLWKCSIPEALQRLESMNIIPSSPKQSESRIKKTGIQIIEVKPIQSKPLFAYLWKRKINPGIAKEYLKEVVFTWNEGKPQYALGFQTNSGSFELRNSILKLSSSPKDIKLIKRNSSNVNVFEGFTDFMSYLVLRNNQVFDDILVLNSTVNTEKALLELHQYKRIRCYLDNDLAGRIATTKIRTAFNEKVIDFAPEYEPFKDLNDFLISSI